MSVELLAIAAKHCLGFSSSNHPIPASTFSADVVLGAVPMSFSGEDHQIPYFLMSPIVQKSAGQKPESRLRENLTQVLEQVVKDAALSPEQIMRMGIFIGSSSFDVGASELAYQQARKTNEDAVALEIAGFGAVAEMAREILAIKGPAFNFNTACTSSANAMLYAKQMIESGDIDHALIVGTEVINKITAQGFYCLDLLSQSPMQPFSELRSGLNLGEAIAAIVLSKISAQGIAGTGMLLCGGATNCDNTSITAANADGSTIASVISEALNDSGISKEDISVIKTHGTASLSNDDAESLGVKHVFLSVPPCVALKPFIGHTLGACGAAEISILNDMCVQGTLFAAKHNLADNASDSDLLNLIKHDLPAKPEAHFLLNFFGFGGNNTSLVLEWRGGVSHE